jgi:hypothetical protein
MVERAFAIALGAHLPEVSSGGFDCRRLQQAATFDRSEVRGEISYVPPSTRTVR